jgi:hypothetical protein
MITVLVVSHERSGTHFLIDSISRNFRNAVFPVIRPSYSSLENLFLPHDKRITEKFYDFLFDRSPEGGVKLFKTHILPLEFEMALERKDYFPDRRDREIVDYLYNCAPKIYIQRDVKDVMVSLFHYMKSGGGLHVAMAERIAEISFSEFIRLPNFHIMPCRSFSDIDKNLVTYWTNHTKQWHKKKIISVTFEELKTNFLAAIQRLSVDLNINHLLLENISPSALPPSPKHPENLMERVFFKIKKRLGFPKIDLSTAVQPRKGIIGDHRSHFSREDYVFVRENLGSYGNPVR